MAEIKEVTKQAPTAKERPNYKYLRDKDREKVRGIFRFFEVPGGSFGFVFKKYKEDSVERYDLVDGNIYELPLGVAKHLNDNCWYPEYDYVKAEGLTGGFNPNGGGMRITKKIRRTAFQSLEFVNEHEMNPKNTIEEVSFVSQIVR